MIKNENGFSALHIALLFVVVGVIGCTGYFVYNSQKDTKELLGNSNTSVSADTPRSNKAETSTVVKEDRRTVNYKDTSYSFALPAGWSFKELDGYDSTDGHYARVSDPTNEFRFDMHTVDYVGSASEGNTPEASFMGINGKTYYLDGYEGSAAKDYETVYISACETKHCLTQLNNTYSLNLSVQRSSDNGVESVAINSKEIETIKKIVASIKLAN